MATIKALKAHMGPHGMVQAGDMIDCDLTRQRALARNGIVAWPDGEGPAEAPRRDRGMITNQSFQPRRQQIVEPVGPTVEEWVAAGYQAKNYPPAPYASRSSQAEIDAAIAAQAAPAPAAKVEKPAKDKSEK